MHGNAGSVPNGDPAHEAFRKHLLLKELEQKKAELEESLPKQLNNYFLIFVCSPKKKLNSYIFLCLHWFPAQVRLRASKQKKVDGSLAMDSGRVVTRAMVPQGQENQKCIKVQDLHISCMFIFKKSYETLLTCPCFSLLLPPG